MSGQKRVCGHSRMGPIMYGHNRRGTEGDDDGSKKESSKSQVEEMWRPGMKDWLKVGGSRSRTAAGGSLTTVVKYAWFWTMDSQEKRPVNSSWIARSW